jgi:uncharacterized membrane protein affecting hemolysin expression
LKNDRRFVVVVIVILVVVVVVFFVVVVHGVVVICCGHKRRVGKYERLNARQAAMYVRGLPGTFLGSYV